MSRSLNALMKKNEFKRFGMPRGSLRLNHLAFADDMIILCKAEVGTMTMISETLRKYEEVSGQKVNKDKSAICLHHNVQGGESVIAELVTGILRKDFPFTYLGCPIFYKRKQKSYYHQMIQRIGAKIQGWKGKLLSYGGRAILIKHVLQSTPIHCLSVMNPPSNVLNLVQRIMAQFFWNSCIGGRGRQWSKWGNLCLPENEGGLGFRLLHDVSMALFCKLWWNFRTKQTLWSEYMRNNITRNGSASLWHDNWTGMGDLYTITGDDFEWDETYVKVADLAIQGEWNVDILNDILPSDLVEHILCHIKPPKERCTEDKPCWMLESRGAFTVKTAWNYIRHKEDPNRIYRWIWTKGMPFKMAFMMWRMWKFKILVDDRLRRWGLEGPSRCWCCDKSDQETLSHVFLKSDFANRTWSYFCSFAGLNITGLQLREVIMLWWGASIKPDQKSFYRAMPSFIIWELWKRRNKKKHEGKNISLPRVIHNVTRNMFMLAKVRRPSMKSGGCWAEILKAMEDYRPRVKVIQVKWEYPQTGWIKYNTNGASKGNPGVSSYAFCLRNERGDIMYVEGACMEHTTNTVAEAKAIVEASKHCKKSHYNQATIQTDSMLMCKGLEGKWATPWIITD
ncbi:hypothetical protein MTR67_042581, partial [Solanum verrucosum]